MKFEEVQSRPFDPASLRMPMQGMPINPDSAFKSFQDAFEQARQKRIEIQMKSLGLDKKGNPLRDSMPELQPLPSASFSTEGIIRQSIYKAPRTPRVYVEPDATPDPDLPEDSSDTTLYLLE